ncbi:MAG: hypothetical protein V1904_10815 [Bacteroidota bacterium]
MKHIINIYTFDDTKHKPMNRILYTISIILTLLAFSERLNAQGKVLVKSIEYDVSIFNEAACLGPYEGPEWWKNNLEISARWYLENSIIKKAKNGSISVYSDEGKVLNNIEVQRILALSFDTITMTRAEPPFDEFDIVIPIPLSPDEIKFLRFRETWSYDLKTFMVTKTISEYAPVIKMNYNDPDSSYNEANVKYLPLFWIKCNAQKSDNKNYITLTHLIESNCKMAKSGLNFFGMYNQVSISDDTVSRKTFFNELCNSAQSGITKIYSPQEVTDYLLYDSDVLEPMEKDEWGSTFSRNDTLTYTRTEPPYDEYDSIIHYKLDPNSLGLFRFQEEWLIDPTTLEMKKEVISFTPPVFSVATP